MVIFGAAGDLTKRLVMPALYNLVTAKQLPDGFRLVGVDHGDKTVEEWRKGLTEMMNEFVTGGGEFQADAFDQAAWKWLTDRMSYLPGRLQRSADLSPAARPSERSCDKTAAARRGNDLCSISPSPTVSSPASSPRSGRRTW